jgi:hypothetical protein
MASQIIEFIKELLTSFLANRTAGNTEVEISVPIGEPKEESQGVDPIPLDWTTASSMITPHFSVGEMIALHAWNRLATEEDGLTEDVKNNLVKLCNIMERVRTILGCSINTHCGFRSAKYNQEVLKSIPHDVHSMGMAIDMDANQTMTIEQAKEKIRPHLEELNIRMEGGTTTWIHLDFHAVGPSGREFKA